MRDPFTSNEAMDEVMSEIEAPALPPALQTGGKIAGIIPRDIEQVFRLAKAVAASGLAPRGMETPEKLTVAIMHGLEIGLPPMMAIQKIAVVNGRPTIWGDAVPALILSKGFRLREWIDESGCAYCEVTRPDGSKTVRTFSEPDARKAGLWGKSGPWTQYPKRMLAMRARGFAARDGASDALSGLYITEELEGVDMKDITPEPERKSAAESKRDGTTEVFNEIRGEIANAVSLEMLDHVIEVHRDELDAMPRKWAQMVQDDYEVKAAEFRATKEVA
jgi:hypothetical protein